MTRLLTRITRILFDLRIIKWYTWVDDEGKGHKVGRI